MTSKIDTTTLKYTIIELKDTKGMSFQKIADLIESEYGIKRTRQAIGKLYQKAKEEEKDQLEWKKIVCDIVNIYSISDNAIDTLANAESIGLNVTYRQILSIIKENQKYIDCVQHTMVANIQIGLKKILSLDDVIQMISYKGISISRKKALEYLEEAYILHIKEVVMSEVTSFFHISGDREKSRCIGETYNIDMRTGSMIQPEPI